MIKLLEGDLYPTGMYNPHLRGKLLALRIFCCGFFKVKIVRYTLVVTALAVICAQNKGCSLYYEEALKLFGLNHKIR